MTKEIVKYTVHYVVHFKEEWKFEPVQIWADSFKQLEQSLKTSEFVKVWWVLHNKYNISHIKPFKLQEDIVWLLQNEDMKVKNFVQNEIKLYKNKLTPWVVKNMIQKAKEELHLI